VLWVLEGGASTRVLPLRKEKAACLGTAAPHSAHWKARIEELQPQQPQPSFRYRQIVSTAVACSMHIYAHQSNN
jgi:hypothetical protein